MTVAAPPWTFDAYTGVDDADGTASAAHAPGGFLGVGGGFAAAVALRAMTGAVADASRPARSLSLHLLAPVRPAPPLTVTPRVERTGGSTTAASVRLEQDGRTVALGHGTFGRGGGTAAVAPRRDLAMPVVPGPYEAPRLTRDPTDGGEMSAHVERRPAADPWPLSGADDARLLVWMRLGEERPVDPLSAVFLADAAVPPLYAALTEPVPIPSMDITVHLAPFPDRVLGPWVLGVFTHRDGADGFVVDDGELWTPEGDLLALTRQLRRVLPA